MTRLAATSLSSLWVPLTILSPLAPRGLPHETPAVAFVVVAIVPANRCDNSRRHPRTCRVHKKTSLAFCGFSSDPSLFPHASFSAPRSPSPSGTLLILTSFTANSNGSPANDLCLVATQNCLAARDPPLLGLPLRPRHTNSLITWGSAVRRVAPSAVQRFVVQEVCLPHVFCDLQQDDRERSLPNFASTTSISSRPNHSV